MSKIFSLKSLEKKILKEKVKGKKIVLCHGTFDLIHLGHIKHFEEAKKFGDILVVSLTSDAFVNKGPNRPYFNIAQRMEAVAALNCVDYVSKIENFTAADAIKKIKPNFYCKGPDYKNFDNDLTGEISNEINLVKKNKGKVVFTNDISFSSSKIINNKLTEYSITEKKFLNSIKKKYNMSKILELLKKSEQTRILVIGEVIIDEYAFCEALGKSGKDSVLALKEIKTEKYLGGSAAICRHLSEFSKKITLLSAIGSQNSHYSFIKKNLPKSVDFKYIIKKKSPSIVKKRFIDNVNLNKVLNIYSINDDFISNSEEKKLIKLSQNLISKHDLVVISDYGHGLITKKLSKFFCKNSNFLALNAQINAANIGYHTMKNYKNTDCVIINQRELEHEMRDRSSGNQVLMKKLSADLKIKNLIVTRGIDGSIFYDSKKNNFYECKAFSKSPVDKIGAGDAMLALSAFFLKSGFSKEMSLLAGSLAAAQSADVIGNKKSVNKKKMIKSLEHILK